METQIIAQNNQGKIVSLQRSMKHVLLDSYSTEYSKRKANLKEGE